MLTVTVCFRLVGVCLCLVVDRTCHELFSEDIPVFVSRQLGESSDDSNVVHLVVFGKDSVPRHSSFVSTNQRSGSIVARLGLVGTKSLFFSLLLTPVWGGVGVLCSRYLFSPPFSLPSSICVLLALPFSSTYPPRLGLLICFTLSLNSRLHKNKPSQVAAEQVVDDSVVGVIL